MRHFKDVFNGGQAVVVGSGPTTCDYDHLNKIGCPIFFLNDAVFMGNFCKSQHFFFTHHPAIEIYLNVEATYIMPRSLIRGSRLGHYHVRRIGKQVPVVIVKCGVEASEYFEPWVFDKDYMAKTSKLVGHGGSITSLLHFLWFCGFRSILGVGINPEPKTCNHDPRIINELERHITFVTEGENGVKRFCPQLDVILTNQQQYIKSFGLDAVYVP